MQQINQIFTLYRDETQISLISKFTSIPDTMLGKTRTIVTLRIQKISRYIFNTTLIV